MNAALSYARRNLRAVLLILAALALSVAAMAVFLPPGLDWQYTFRPVVFELLAGHSPYQISWDQCTYFKAPWALLPMILLAVLPVQVGRALLVILTILSLAYVAHRLGGKPLGCWAAAPHKRKFEFPVVASPCLSPYLVTHSWAPALLAVVSWQSETAAAVVGFWNLIVIRGFGG